MCTARCWRDGQKKKCYLYRFLATGSIEEKVFQRQLSKESLQNVVNGEGTLEQSSMSKEELRRLFTLDDGTVSDTHDCGGCERCPSKNFEGLHGSADGAAWEEQDDEAVETDLNTWGHHHRMDHVPDPIMRRAAGDDVSFIFSLQVEGCAIVEKEKPKDAGAGEKTAAAPPPASTATRPGGYRLGAGAGGPAGPAGTAGTAGTMRPPAPMRRPLAPVAAKPNVVQAAAGAGRKAPAPSKKTAPPPAKKAKKGKKDDSESEMELDDSESESESESEEEFESEAEESGDDDEDEEEDDGSGSDEKAPAARAGKKTTTPARPMRGAAAAAAAILNDPAATAKTTAAEPDSDSDPASESDEPVADSEEDEEDAGGAERTGAPSAGRRAPARGDVNRASVNVAGVSARAGVEVDAARHSRRKSEVVASISPDDSSDSEELAMIGSDDDDDDDEYSESE